MGYFLASGDGEAVRRAWVKRFAARLWTVDFARPMMAALTVPAVRTLRVELDFHTRGDLAGLIWASEDRWSHPLLAYATERDYRGVTLAFDWVSGPGVKAMDAVNGPTLTIEGRNAAGEAATWYVRLWNYATGTPSAARVELDFDDMQSGFGMADGAVWAADIDRMFISIVPEGYDGTGESLAAGISTWVELRNLAANGVRSAIAMGDAFLPEHRLRICSGYDDSYHQPPERLVEQWRALGYRGIGNHYVGMSHYFALAQVGAGRFEVADGLCASAIAWHRGLLRAAATAGLELIFSLSFEVFDAHAPAAWAQRDHAGGRALTGWEPPSTLLSPCNGDAVGWLAGIAASFAELMAEGGGAVRFQVGEPWWWLGPAGRPCFYDTATVAAWTAEHGASPPMMADVNGERTAAERQFLDWLGERLAAATFAVRDAAGALAADRFQSLLLFYAPQVLDDARPDLRRANMPVGWGWPAWDVLQLEDYDYVTGGDEAGQAKARREVSATLGYPEAEQHYLSGFVLRAQDAAVAWRRIGEAAAGAMRSEVAEVLVWAWPQVARDGFTWTGLGEGENAVGQFHDVRFPLELGFDAVGGPVFATQVAQLASGHEQRNMQWAQGRLSYDAAPGVRSESDLVRLLEFFRARRGQAYAFRFRDPIDWRSCGTDAAIDARDQLLGIADGGRLRFELVKRYGEVEGGEERRITRPVADSVVVSVDGGQVFGWELDDGGVVRFEEPPPQGAEVRAGFAFDVPVRFAADRIDISLSRWRGGELPAVPLVEVRE